jgi:hypothetical protein
MKKTILITLLACSFSQFAIADDHPSLALSLGAFDVNDDDTAAEFGVEYRFASVESAFNLIPTVGITANSDGGYWAYAGVRYDIELSDTWILTPSFAVVGYEQGGGKDLGHGLEFKTGIELGYALSDDSRIGLGIYHLSNANIGDRNPGQESVYLSYSFGL